MNNFFDMLGWSIIILLAFGFFLGYSCRSSFEGGSRMRLKESQTYNVAIGAPTSLDE